MLPENPTNSPFVTVHVVRVDAEQRPGRHVVPAEGDVLAEGAPEEGHGRVKAQRFLEAPLEQLHLGQVRHRGRSVRAGENRINFLVHSLLHVRR